MNTPLPKSVHWVFHHCDDVMNDAMRARWTKKWPRLEKLLANSSLEVQDARLTVTCHRPMGLQPWFDFHAVLKLPVGKLVADASGNEPEALIDQAIDLLAHEVKRRKERGSKGFVAKRKRRAHSQPSTAGPPQRGLAQRQDFFALFRPLLPLLQAHARNELRTLEAKGLLHRGELTVRDLLDEALTQAWQKYEERPRGLSLEAWFTELLQRGVEQWIRQEPHPYRSVDEPVREELPSDEQPQIGDQEWWTWLLGDHDSSTVADLLPARESVDTSSEEAASADADLQDDAASRETASAGATSRDTAAPLGPPGAGDRVWLLLGELPTFERQALVLHALDGLAPFEIAMLQDRPESEVRGDIEAAQKTLRERLLAGGSAQGNGAPPKAARSAASAPGAAKTGRGGGGA